ncbi:hypothetical protein M406DRAFT_357325 [Cryphonectria parasitica EP155]|uniref:Protein HRI1 n=1 Tax=Cryphonectria parasitica (strain ATCC 38755 / EP155) TaxID=660469 RepID=A0A9P5CLQ1_CRYP1|nr:uncharacterized protein M406DRAFT_357325 [Cryphonectria parasitica EP155]KAF3762065.1 hypothetical protein M406DRAFT_357325 [Cryphonectria parasitica EP155]
MGTISVRDHIKWGTDDPSEPTSTLVLTSPSRWFVDIRVLKTALPVPTDARHVVLSDLTDNQLDWAFGGTSSTSQLTRENGTHVSHSTFRHWVDSRTTSPEEVVDEGDMFEQPSGLTLETGHMVNPATGYDTEYEELWRDEQPQPVPGLAKCIVLRAHDDANETRGLFVCLGQYAQGVIRRGHIFTAERWIWNSSDSKWERQLRWGTHSTPTLRDLVCSLGKTYEKNDRVETSSGTWTVIEKVD